MGTSQVFLYLDTAMGVNPIVMKLPYALLKKWLSYGSSYKERYQLALPPFFVFLNFISNQSKIRDDPSFNLSAQVDTSVKRDKPTWREREIFVHETDVFTPTSFNYNIKQEEPGKRCPIHRKPLFSNVLLFTKSYWNNVKPLLRDHRIHYRCCVSSTHTARECKSDIKCTGCESEKHPSALHPGPAPSIMHATSLSGHGGEREPTLALEGLAEVTAECTDVSEGNLTDRHCSKIRLANVYPAGH